MKAGRLFFDSRASQIPVLKLFASFFYEFYSSEFVFILIFYKIKSSRNVKKKLIEVLYFQKISKSRKSSFLEKKFDFFIKLFKNFKKNRFCILNFFSDIFQSEAILHSQRLKFFKPILFRKFDLFQYYKNVKLKLTKPFLVSRLYLTRSPHFSSSLLFSSFLLQDSPV